MKLKVTIVSIFFFIILFSGCIGNEPPSNQQRQILSIKTDISLNYSEVVNISYDTIKLELENRSYSVGPKYSNAPDNYVIPITKEQNGTLQIAIFWNTNKTTATLDLLYRPILSYNVSSAKNYMIYNGNIIADVCNLTISWKNNEWYVSYAD
jgi:hypothetical protein